MEKLIDLTHTLSTNVPSWDGGCGFSLAIDMDYSQCRGSDKFRTHSLSCRAGIGTHLDAPAHCIEGALNVHDLKLRSLVARCVVIDVSLVAGEDYVAGPEVVGRYEQTFGPVDPGSFVLFNTGWARYWADKERYRNGLVFPSIHEDTAKVLLERNIVGLGIDTLSPDARGTSFPVHRAVLGAGKYIVENVANAGELPPSGAMVFVLPMKIEATEAPVRMMGIVPSSR